MKIKHNNLYEYLGYYRLIDFKFEANALSMMLDLIEENSWAIDEIDKEESYGTLKDFIPKSVFEVLFEKYAEASSKTKQDGSPLYKYISRTSIFFLLIGKDSISFHLL